MVHELNGGAQSEVSAPTHRALDEWVTGLQVRRSHDRLDKHKTAERSRPFELGKQQPGAAERVPNTKHGLPRAPALTEQLKDVARRDRAPLVPFGRDARARRRLAAAVARPVERNYLRTQRRRQRRRQVLQRRPPHARIKPCPVGEEKKRLAGGRSAQPSAKEGKPAA
eukprot:CAMPEP_0180041880 /NCGR_PEP_ID=MMETSP0984-20121128/34410_1 /TAXON_ID=483367 /ORGANISM="non described non described, Strain CCMP 2436" /LENGTH=167 /DNA_ID=CAMNT_0021969579 /DNA_START=556 /DNA_END=1056 /DNA_ORIENTATION=+